MTRTEADNALLKAARDYTDAERNLDRLVLTERDIIERNRAERLLKEAAVAYAVVIRDAATIK